ncbi:MAG: hypothetical protein K0S65_1083 [Labilithrix sp.]|nr:hypothetical protein [Labilithrix sp.]
MRSGLEGFGPHNPWILRAPRGGTGDARVKLMGMGSDHASSIEAPGMPMNGLLAPANMPPNDSLPPTAQTAPTEAARAPQDTPLWMEVSTSRPEPRRGHAATSPRSMNTIVFFALIVVAVAAAGIGGVAVWGPEKTIKNRTQFATNPPSPTVLPSLPPAEASEPPPAEPTSASAAPAETTPPPVISAAPKKATKKTRAGKKH